jgi:hypothetical protein
MYEIQERCAAGFWWGHLRERDHLEDLVKLIFKGQAEDAWTGLIWLRIGTNVGLL